MAVKFESRSLVFKLTVKLKIKKARLIQWIRLGSYDKEMCYDLDEGESTY